MYYHAKLPDAQKTFASLFTEHWLGLGTAVE